MLFAEDLMNGFLWSKLKECPLWKPGRDLVSVFLPSWSKGQPPMNFDLFKTTEKEKAAVAGTSDIRTMEKKGLLFSSLGCKI